jgi:hypothetical protein
VISGTSARVVAVTDECTCATDIAIRQSGAALAESPTSAKAARSRRVSRIGRPYAASRPSIDAAAITVRTAISVSGGTAATAILVNM